MKTTNLTKYLFLILLSFYAADVSAQCATAPTCEGLGYKMTKAQCSGKKYISCPMDFKKVFCSGNIIGEVKPFAGKEVPNGWLKANGASVSSAKYSQLYAVIGTTFGGTISNFKLPDLSGKMVAGAASGSYASNKLGAIGGAEKVTLTVAEMASHGHGWTGRIGTGNPNDAGHSNGAGAWQERSYPRRTQTAYRGGSAAHNNMPPYLAMDFIIFTGVYEGE